MSPSDVVTALHAIAEADGDSVARNLANSIAEGVADVGRLVRTAARIGKWREGADPGAAMWRDLARQLGQTPVYP